MSLHEPIASRPARFIRGLIEKFAGLGTTVGASARLALRERETRTLTELCRALLSERGEASGIALAVDGLARYRALEPAERVRFFDALAREFSPDPAQVAKHADAYTRDPSQGHLVLLQKAVESPRQELFRRLNMAPGGTAALVELRRELLAELDKNPELVGVDTDLQHLFTSWFNRGFLELRRIDWNTPAAVLEKLIKYEAVHAMQGWEDLRRRLDRDRRCFAFFHPALPDEPLIFVEVALVEGIAEAVGPLLAADKISDASKANTAIFYSITNCQDGLRGVSFGSFLIKQVAAELGRELPRVRTFATLSPIPGFRRWLESERGRLGAEHAALLARDDWSSEEAAVATLKEPLSRLCAWYLLHAKRGKTGLPLDPVGRFHLANGASLERVNWLADTSAKGVRESCTLMVNYLYDLDAIERNHDAYANGDPIIAAHRVEALAAKAPGA